MIDRKMRKNEKEGVMQRENERIIYHLMHFNEKANHFTGTSVVVALFIGGLEALGLLMDKFALSGGIWRWVGALNDNLGDAGFVVVGLFVACWALSVLNYRWRGYDNLAR